MRLIDTFRFAFVINIRVLSSVCDPGFQTHLKIPLSVVHSGILTALYWVYLIRNRFSKVIVKVIVMDSAVPDYL